MLLLRVSWPVLQDRCHGKILLSFFSNSCEIEDLVETHYLRERCVILRSRVATGVLCGLVQEVQPVYEGDKICEAAEFKEWVCLYFGKY